MDKGASVLQQGDARHGRHTGEVINFLPSKIIPPFPEVHTPAESIIWVYLRERVQAVLFDGTRNSHRSPRQGMIWSYEGQPNISLVSKSQAVLQKGPVPSQGLGTNRTGRQWLFRAPHKGSLVRNSSGLLVFTVSTGQFSETTGEEV